MYTLLELQSKTLGALKEIGYELNVLPAGDRRCRQSWIDALVGVNPPLLQLLEVSPGVEVDRVQEPIIETVEASPVASVEQVQESPIESKFGRIVYPKPATKPISQNEEARPLFCRTESVDVHNLGFHPTESDRDSSGAKTEALGSQEGDRVLAVARDCETGRGRILPGQSIKLVNFTEAYRLEDEPKMSQRAIAQAAENPPGVEVSVSDRKRYWADRGFFLIPEIPAAPEQNPAVEFDGCIYCTSPEYKSWRNETYRCYRCEPEPDQNPILTGITFSDRFLTRYAPPPSEIIHFQPDADGQLSLLNFDIESVDEPPDPDDFESLDAFREAIARWDWEHPTSNFDHCSDLLPSSVHSELNSVHSETNSVHCKPPDPHDFDSMFAFWAAYDAWEASNDDSEPLEVSFDSFCEWAPCPPDWYESIALDGSSKVLELSPVRKSSSTSDFFIPTFGLWGDQSNRNDEPPDTGIFARLPKPKPPKFPPQAASRTQVGHKLDASQPNSAQVSEVSRTYPETIPKLFHRVVACSTLPARSPPGGDA